MIDESWEYWTGDPEIEEILATSARCKPLDRIMDTRVAADPKGYPGLRFGHGNPDTFYGRLGSERQTAQEATPKELQRIVCYRPGCGRVFQQRQPTIVYCSKACAGLHQWQDVDRSILCPVCNVRFQPKHSTQVHCSRRCAAVTLSARRKSAGIAPPRQDYSKRKQPLRTSRTPHETGCRRCGGDIPPSPRRDKVYCSRRCKNLWVQLAAADRRRDARNASTP